VIMEGVSVLKERSWKKIIQQVVVVFLLTGLIVAITVNGLVRMNAFHVGNFVKTWQLIRSNYIDTVSFELLMDGATKGIVDVLGDPYSTYLGAQDKQQLMEQVVGKFGGIGIVLNTNDQKKLIVLRTIRNTPAERAGIQSGDEIIKIDDTNVATLTQAQAIGKMRGDPGTSVTLDIFRENEQKTLTIDLIRERITVPTIDAEVLPGHPEIVYIGISQFSAETGNEMAEVMKELDINRFRGIILDLRYNHGGEFNAAIQVASHFIPSGPVVHIVNRHGKVEIEKSTGAAYWGKALVVLVNRESASAAEIVAGAIKDTGAGILVGEKTFGKGIVQTIFELDDETSIKLTTAKYLTPNENDIHTIGIEPDIIVELDKDQRATLAPTGTEFDAQLKKAVQTLEWIW